MLDLIAENNYPDPEFLSAFENNQAAYLAAAGRLKLVSVPAAYVFYNADLVNNFQNLAIINGVFSGIARDPLNAVLYLAPYKKEAERFQAVLTGIAGRLRKDNILFLQGGIGQTLLSYLENSD